MNRSSIAHLPTTVSTLPKGPGISEPTNLGDMLRNFPVAQEVTLRPCSGLLVKLFGGLA